MKNEYLIHYDEKSINPSYKESYKALYSENKKDITIDYLKIVHPCSFINDLSFKMVNTFPIFKVKQVENIEGKLH